MLEQQIGTGAEAYLAAQARCTGLDPQSAPDEMARVLDRPPPVSPELLRDDTQLTRRWTHGAVHAALRPMAGHVVMVYHGGEHAMSWRHGGTRLASWTRPGTIMVIPEGKGGHWEIGGAVEVSHVYLSDQRLQSCADVFTDGRRVELIDRACLADPVAAHLLQMLCQEASASARSARVFVEQTVDLLCTQLIRGHSSFGALTPAAPRRGLADWQVKRVTTHMRDHLDGEIGLKDLAALVGLSRFHFCTAFRLATGQTPYEWLTTERMTRARQLLAEANLTITDVALSVGYETPSAFTAAFRRSVGTTPSQFRRGL